jgi:hypothetical protein
VGGARPTTVRYNSWSLLSTNARVWSTFESQRVGCSRHSDRCLAPLACSRAPLSTCNVLLESPFVISIRPLVPVDHLVISILPSAPPYNQETAEAEARVIAVPLLDSMIGPTCCQSHQLFTGFSNQRVPWTGYHSDHGPIDENVIRTCRMLRSGTADVARLRRQDLGGFSAEPPVNTR